jgi:predicted NUDIX family phosphoesterase
MLTIGKFEIDEQMEKKVDITVKAKVNQEYKEKYSKLIYYCLIQKSKVLLVTSRSRRTRP